VKKIRIPDSLKHCDYHYACTNRGLKHYFAVIGSMIMILPICKSGINKLNKNYILKPEDLEKIVNKALNKALNKDYILKKEIKPEDLERIIEKVKIHNLKCDFNLEMDKIIEMGRGLKYSEEKIINIIKKKMTEEDIREIIE
jgi:uncharacterized protein (UPF0332 family)